MLALASVLALTFPTTIVGWAMLIILIAAVVAIVAIALREYKVQIPPWAIHVAWVVVVAIVCIAAIKIIASL